MLSGYFDAPCPMFSSRWGRVSVLDPGSPGSARWKPSRALQACFRCWNLSKVWSDHHLCVKPNTEPYQLVLFHKSSNWGSLKKSWVYRWNPPLESRKPCWSNHDRGELPLCHALSMLPCLSRQRALTEAVWENQTWLEKSPNINLGTEQWGNHQMGRLGIVPLPMFDYSFLPEVFKLLIGLQGRKFTSLLDQTRVHHGTSKKESDLKNCQEFTIHIHTS